MSSNIQAERRAHRRFDVPCPARVVPLSPAPTLHGRTFNVSDGGALLTTEELGPDLPRPGQRVELQLSLPRSTPNTFMYEPVAGRGYVVRRERVEETGQTVLAVRFDHPLDLQIQV